MDFIEKIIKGCLWLMWFILIVMFVGVIMIVIDESKTHKDDKLFWYCVQSHSQTTMTMAGKIIIPTITQICDEGQFRVQINGKIYEIGKEIK